MQILFILTKQLELFYGRHWQAILKYILLPLLIGSLVLFSDHKILAQSTLSIPLEFWVQTSDGTFYFNSNGCARSGFSLPYSSVAGGNWTQCESLLPNFIKVNEPSQSQNTTRQDEILKSLSVLLAVSFICFITYFFWQALSF